MTPQRSLETSRENSYEKEDRYYDSYAVDPKSTVMIYSPMDEYQYKDENDPLSYNSRPMKWVFREFEVASIKVNFSFIFLVLPTTPPMMPFNEQIWVGKTPCTMSTMTRTQPINSQFIPKSITNIITMMAPLKACRRIDNGTVEVDVRRWIKHCQRFPSNTVIVSVMTFTIGMEYRCHQRRQMLRRRHDCCHNHIRNMLVRMERQLECYQQCQLNLESFGHLWDVVTPNTVIRYAWELEVYVPLTRVYKLYTYLYIVELSDSYLYVVMQVHI